MAVNLEEVKINVRGILTSSKDSISIENLRRDYRIIEGVNLPYKSLGFNSDIELLQNMPDVLTLPQNPNSSSIMSLVVGEKTNHMRILVSKQKSNNSKKNRKSNSNGQCNMHNNTNKYYKSSPNSSQNTSYNNYMNNNQNRSNHYKSNSHNSYDTNEKNQPSTSNRRVCFNQKNLNQNGFDSSGIVTDALRAYLEFNLFQNQKLISKKKLEELVRSHKDFPAFKTENMNDIFNMLEHFLQINNTGVSLKSISPFKDGEHPVIYQEPDKSSNSSNELHQSQLNDSYKNVFSKNDFNNGHKIMNSSKQFGCNQYNDKNVSFQSKRNLKMNDHSSNDNNFKILLHKTKHIPKKVLFNIIKLFEVYNYGVNIENFKFIYNEEYYNTIDPSAYGFTTVGQMFKDFDELIDIKNEIMYTKPTFEFSMLYKIIHFNNDAFEKQINHNIVNNKSEISLDIYNKSPFVDMTKKCKMVMVEAYNPSLFYLQIESNIKALGDLMKDMREFYERENSNYCVQPEQITPGDFYVSSYSTFSDRKQWHRVRILREVNSMTVEVSHVDYGTVDNVPKTEIRFLYHTFSKFPCQAIHCCLDSYNELDSIAPEVTKAFLEIIDNKPVFVQVDKYFSFKSRYKILHVTLFKCENEYEDLKNINNELTICHLNR